MWVDVFIKSISAFLMAFEFFLRLLGHLIMFELIWIICSSKYGSHYSGWGNPLTHLLSTINPTVMTMCPRYGASPSIKGIGGSAVCAFSAVQGTADSCQGTGDSLAESMDHRKRLSSQQMVQQISVVILSAVLGSITARSYIGGPCEGSGTSGGLSCFISSRRRF